LSVIFVTDGKKQKKPKKNKKKQKNRKQKKTSVKHIRIRLIGGCVNQWRIATGGLWVRVQGLHRLQDIRSYTSAGAIKPPPLNTPLAGVFASQIDR